ncbi:hypothetical protein [Thauera sp.]|uniref:hypothetical protein n=1 Tax=Thauera sp. TaxID=1905334 RepID=UPI0039E41134
MDDKKCFRIVNAVFWLGVLALVALDTFHTRGVRLEPPAFALGSGQAASGGHCSGR